MDDELNIERYCNLEALIDLQCILGALIQGDFTESVGTVTQRPILLACKLYCKNMDILSPL